MIIGSLEKFSKKLDIIFNKRYLTRYRGINAIWVYYPNDDMIMLTAGSAVARDIENVVDLCQGFKNMTDLQKYFRNYLKQAINENWGCFEEDW